MNTLYDLLGARADDDAETLKKAFRKAVKAAHPDLNAGDPDASLRFRQIVYANAILRDAERRMTYDQLLRLEREQLRWKRSKRRRTIVSNTIAVAVFLFVLAGGHERFAPGSMTSLVAVEKDQEAATAIVAVKADMDDAGGPAGMAAIRSSTRTDPKGGDGPHDNDNEVEVPDRGIEPSAAAPLTDCDDALEIAGHGPAPGLLSNDAKFYRERGIASYRSGDFPRAIADFDEAIRLDPNDVQAYNIRGNAWDETGAVDRALADYEQAIRIDPNNPAIFHDRAILWRRKGELDRALVDLDRAIRFTFSDANIYCDRGLVWFEKGRYDRAMADFNQAIRIDPNFARPYINRGVISHRKRDFDAAFAKADQAIRTGSNILDVIRRANLHP
jgi:tetratricopeptide (TPR) repeat protein